MNTLSYGLLSLLSNASNSGYDLMLKLQPFWPAKHSQIYPLLAQLDQDGYVVHELVVQKDKPDKKVYSITEKGREALRAWLAKPADEPVHRDELTLKLYCLHEGDIADIRKLLHVRIEYSRDRMLWMHGKIEAYARQEQPPTLAVQLLMQKGLFHFQSDLAWAEWALLQLADRQPKQDN
ncbi:PadR family transcriptional regulator [Paenibacillus koleovorans]|uniref:PadR family transcriptional regulator n=1 Tax=Paenibacillus koleovorans TaxID=121608 RepID=UPI000FD9AB1D|nr:PadR family transcriptional regulator [Paenibacillus koleovorans]